jgi:hypothetical protein
MKIATSASLIKSHSHKRSLLAAFASSPLPVLKSFIASQSATLTSIISADRGAQSNPVGGGAAWREEMRRGEVWQGGWLEEGASAYSIRAQQGPK